MITGTDGAGPKAASAARRPADRDVQPLIQASHVHKVYETGDGVVHALDDVSFTVRDGEFVSVVGKSGCGKSTLLNLIAGLDFPSQGTLVLGGAAVTEPRSREIGYVFQQPVLLPWRSILDNVLLQIELLRLSRQSYRDRADELLELVGLKGFERRFPAQLSGGMQQRAAIVRALIHEPSVLLMDEPFGALDAISREYMNLELLRIREATGSTIVFVTHDLREAAFLSNRVVVMTPRPGTVRAIVESPTPFPRTRDVMFTEEFTAVVRELEDLIA
jgi:NitT/TauT family transport system ATP-binding protein